MNQKTWNELPHELPCPVLNLTGTGSTLIECACSRENVVGILAELSADSQAVIASIYKRHVEDQVELDKLLKRNKYAEAYLAQWKERAHRALNALQMANRK